MTPNHHASQLVPVAAIIEGKRRREEYGDIPKLAESMAKHGQLQPIIVDYLPNKQFRLVVGGRRLRAAKHLGWKEIRAEPRSQLSEQDLRDIELIENELRLGYTEKERAKTFFESKAIVNGANEVLASLAKTPKYKEGKGGRPAKQGAALAAAADELGVPRTTVQHAQAHVATAEKFGFMQGWRQSEVLAVHERLEVLPVAEVDSVKDIFQEAVRAMTPQRAVQILDYLNQQPPESRAQIYDLIHSPDPRNRSLAMTRVVELPPMVDPRLNLIDRATRALEAGRTLIYHAYNPFPNDPLTPEFREVRDDLKALINKLAGLETEVKKVSYDAGGTGTETVQ